MSEVQAAVEQFVIQTIPRSINDDALVKALCVFLSDQLTDATAIDNVQISELETKVESLQLSISTLISERNELSKSLETMLRIIHDRVRWGAHETIFAEETLGRANAALRRIGPNRV